MIQRHQYLHQFIYFCLLLLQFLIQPRRFLRCLLLQLLIMYWYLCFNQLHLHNNSYRLVKHRELFFVIYIFKVSSFFRNSRLGDDIVPLLLLMTFRMEYTPPWIKYPTEHQNEICQVVWDIFCWDGPQFDNAFTTKTSANIESARVIDIFQKNHQNWSEHLTRMTKIK